MIIRNPNFAEFSPLLKDIIIAQWKSGTTYQLSLADLEAGKVTLAQLRALACELGQMGASDHIIVHTDMDTIYANNYCVRTVRDCTQLSFR